MIIVTNTVTYNDVTIMRGSPEHRKKILDIRTFGSPSTLDHRPLVEVGDNMDTISVYMAYFDDDTEVVSNLTAWLYACMCGHVRVIRVLWPDIKSSNDRIEFQRDEYGNTGLLLACRYGRAAVVRELIARKADMTVTNYDNKGVYDVTRDAQVLQLLTDHIHVPPIHYTALRYDVPDELLVSVASCCVACMVYLLY